MYDTIVVGLGAMGSACAWQLARRGQRVLGLDRFHPPHDRGSSHGETRITRCAVGEGTAYVPLVQRSHAIWREVEAETGLALLDTCGALILGAPGAQVHGKADFVGRTIAAAQQFGIPHDVLDAAEITRRYPQFITRGDERGYVEPGAGLVRPERCIEAQLVMAARSGAHVRMGATVVGIEQDGAGARVTLADGTVHGAGAVVLAAGAWIPGLLPAVAPHLSVTRQVLHWFAVADEAAWAPARCPVFIWMHGDRPEDTFYGFPNQGAGDGVKVATEQYDDVTAGADALRREVQAEEVEAMFGDHIAGRLVGVGPQALRSKVCQYTMTGDGDFLVDRVGNAGRVWVVSACSGHGFKHSAGLGEALAKAMGGAGTEALAVFGGARLRDLA